MVPTAPTSPLTLSTRTSTPAQRPRTPVHTYTTTPDRYTPPTYVHRSSLPNLLHRNRNNHDLPPHQHPLTKPSVRAQQTRQCNVHRTTHRQQHPFVVRKAPAPATNNACNGSAGYIATNTRRAYAVTKPCRPTATFHVYIVMPIIGIKHTAGHDTSHLHVRSRGVDRCSVSIFRGGFQMARRNMCLEGTQLSDGGSKFCFCGGSAPPNPPFPPNGPRHGPVSFGLGPQ